MNTTLAQVYGFEGTVALTVFGVGVGLLVLLAALFVRASVRLWIIGAMFFFACVGFAVKTLSGVAAVNETWMLSVQMHRSDFYLALGLLLAAFSLAGLRGIRGGDVPIQGLLLLLIGLYAGVLRVVHEGPEEGLLSIGFSLATVLPVLLALPALLRDFDDILKLLRVIMFVSVIWAACCAVQFVVNPQALLARELGGRFLGMTANAQFVALQCGCWSFIALWLLLNDPKRRLRIVWLGLVGINLIFTAWSGSRMGVLVVLAGSTFVLLSRIGRAVLFLPVIGLVTFGLYTLSDDLMISDNIEHLISKEDTRSQVWYRQVQVGMENPIFGTGFAEAGGSENSYLVGFSAYGIGMALLILALLIASAVVMVRLYKNKRLLPPDQRPIVDLILGFNAAFFLAAFFDGLIISRIGGALSLMLMFSAMALRVSRLQEEAGAASSLPDDYSRHDDAPDHADGLRGEAAPDAA